MHSYGQYQPVGYATTALRLTTKTCAFTLVPKLESRIPHRKLYREEGAYKTIERKIKLRNSFLASVREVEIIDDDGRSRTRLTFPVPLRIFQRVFERVTRGLYFFHTGRILPADVSVSATELPDMPDMDADYLSHLKSESVGEGAFIYRYAVVPNDVNCSHWIYEFHQANWAMVTTGIND